MASRSTAKPSTSELNDTTSLTTNTADEPELPTPDDETTEPEPEKKSTFPALLTLALPPCGLIPQLAYLNTVTALRALYLSSPGTSLLALCKTLQQPNQHPRYWRLPSVSIFESRWTAFFVREARVLERWDGMGVKERGRVLFKEEVEGVPKEVGIRVRKGRGDVVGMWEVWLGKVRGDRGRG